MKDRKDSLRVWVWGDAHVGTDLRHGRTSLADALCQSEGRDPDGAPGFAWDIAIDIGDMSGGQAVPEDAEGTEIVHQFGVLEKHLREAIYSVCGNHDRSGLNEPDAWWWQKWVDPMGSHTAYSGVNASRRPYPVTGTWERYSFRIGNLLFLMMSDVNEDSQTIGRGDLGGNPAGVVRQETFEWWQEQIENNSDALIVSTHHYMLKNTTVASGEWEGMRRQADGRWEGHYHGYKPLGAPKGASYLYFVGGKPDAGAFEGYLEHHPDSVALWLGGHTHAHPDDTYGGKSHIEERWGCHFINAACLSRFHGFTNVPKSRLLTFTPGSCEVRVQCYMHTSEFLPVGWYDDAEAGLTLPRAFQWEG